ncbi:MAG: 1,4-alpha-glucan branching protein domain-containing protein [Candidatus Coatesbacteria bacterium]
MKNGVALTLHAHLPFVLNHGRWPHGADWLNEAAAETYLPLLAAMRNLERDGVPFKINIGLSPVLCEQLASPAFREEFSLYLETKVQAARENAGGFAARGETALEKLAHGWERFYSDTRDHWCNQWGGSILDGFRYFLKTGNLEIMTCAATHGYMPLLGRDTACQAQIRIAVATHRKHFGMAPRGIWLPECAYRPAYTWSPPVGARWPATARKATDEFLSESGLTFFVIDTHMLRGGQAVGLYLARFEALRKLWARFERETRKPLDAERSPHRPYWVHSNPEGRAPVCVFTRDPDTGIVVWSGEHGYPGDGAYLDFHKKHFPGGLRYWRVTRPKSELHEKEIYEPEKIEARLDENAAHFVGLARRLLSGAGQGDEPRILTAPYDAELYGHWWFEGVRFLEKAIRGFAASPDVETVRLGDHLEAHPPEEVIALPEGSWGQGGFHWIWLNEHTQWTWDRIYDAEDRMEKLAGELTRREQAGVPGTRQLREVLSIAARELLMMEASDWQFLISTWSARDYAEMRLARHAGDFGSVAGIADKLLTGQLPGEEEQILLANLSNRDFAFAGVDPALWARVDHP